ncbi:serine protease hepsin-like [Haliotis rubra]|uniref:serine protease hepsin-like n=1 Tax=Haliotis rubra TaxID=36100 RepID=UPI001EE55AD6|nr:serine protease hepsin-like [Haliotis rubra]
MHLLRVIVSVCVICSGVRAAEICSALYPRSTCQPECPQPSVTEAQGAPYCYSGMFCCETVTTPTPSPTTTPPPTTTTTPPSRVCGFDALPVTPRIMNSNPFNLNDFSCAWPWMVHVLYDLQDGEGIQPLCSGVLVSKQQFITLKSFVEPLTGQNFQLYAAVGICNITGLQTEEVFPPGTLKNVSTDISSFDAGNLDLVVATLEEEVGDYSINVLPACLPDGRTVINGDQCFMAGSANGEIGAGRVRVLDPAVCTAFNNILINNEQQPRGTFCTNVFSDNVDACDGDEGGMVICQDNENRWVLKGIIQEGTCLGARNGANVIIDIEQIGSDLISNVFPTPQ